MMKAFESRAFVLARNGCIRSLKKRYDMDGRELIQISFFGQESEMLVESLSVIKEFFSRLIADAERRYRNAAKVGEALKIIETKPMFSNYKPIRKIMKRKRQGKRKTEGL